MTPLKKISLAAVGALSAGSMLSAAPMVALGDDAALFLTGQVGISYEDNIFRDRQGRVDDVKFRFQPGIELQLMPQGAATASLFASAEVIRYADLSELNDEFFHLLLVASLDERVYQLGFLASYDERAVNTADANRDGVLLTLDDVAVHVNGRYNFSNLTSIGAGFMYDRRDFDNPGLAGSESRSVPVTLFYEVTPVLDAKIGYRWRKVDVIGVPLRLADYRDDTFFTGLVGELGSPVFTGDVSIGWTRRDFRAHPLFPQWDRRMSSLTYDLGVTYNATNSSYTLRVERDYLTSVNQGQNFSRSQVSLLGRFPLVPMWSATAMVGYSYSDYSGSARTQDDYFGRVGLIYNPNEYVTVSANITHNRVDGSGAQASEYRANIFSLSASLRY